MIKNLPDEQKELVFSKPGKWLEVAPADLYKPARSASHCVIFKYLNKFGNVKIN